MFDSFIELSKYLNLEEAKGFTDKSIAGGFGKLLPHWKNRALGEGVNTEKVDFIQKQFEDYASLNIQDREKRIQNIRAFLSKVETDDKSKSKPTKKGKKETAQGKSYQPKAVFAPLTVIHGIGDKMAQKLTKLGLGTIYDLLHHYPHRYNDYSQLTPISKLVVGEEVTVSGSIQTIHERKSRKTKRSIVEGIVTDGTGFLWITWFNQPWIMNKLKPGKQIVLSGKISIYQGQKSVSNPEWEPLDSRHLHTNRIVPVYPLTAGVQQKWLREKIFLASKYWSERIIDYLPEQILDNESLMPLSDAIRAIHFPETQDELQEATERLSFDEIFFMQLGAVRQKKEWESIPAEKYQIDDVLLSEEIEGLPYKLTKAQNHAIQDIRDDLLKGRQMNRLLQGDVGSGKTIVSRFAMEIIIRSGKQAALLAPTSILAQQHYQSIKEMLLKDKVLEENQMALLIGDTPENEKEQIREGLSSGDILFVVGTHALLEGPVQFNGLQMVVIDEQHRFGVQQRAILRQKGKNPHILIMSATPIPRSLSLTIYGDLDISILDELPGGRKPIETIFLYPSERDVAYDKIREQVVQGYQAFIVFPRIEGQEEEDTSSVLSGYEHLQSTIFPEFNLGLLHGRMKQEEKDAIMHSFRDGQMDILASTTVIEVGMDIPNATCILIEGADHFGLAQLHQLRGRVGRNAVQSYCYLIPDSDTKTENERLQKMVSTTDGFELAEFDLKTRGPGDFFGTRQSGYKGLKLASISDIKLISRAREQAFHLFDRDPDLSLPENQALRLELDNLWKPINGELS